MPNYRVSIYYKILEVMNPNIFELDSPCVIGGNKYTPIYYKQNCLQKFIGAKRKLAGYIYISKETTEIFVNKIDLAHKLGKAFENHPETQVILGQF